MLRCAKVKFDNVLKIAPNYKFLLIMENMRTRRIISMNFFYYRGHKSYITSVSVFDKYVFTGGADALIKKWDLASCRPMFTYRGHNSKIHKLLVTEDLVFSTSHDKTAKVWHTRITKANHTRACIRTLKVSNKS